MKNINSDYEILLADNSLLFNIPRFLAKICATNLFKRMCGEQKCDKAEGIKKLLNFDYPSRHFESQKRCNFL
jgi:hypothetical protein